MFSLVWTAAFTRAAEDFVRRHPDLHGRLATVLRDLERDPYQPHLRHHPLRGKLKGVRAVRLTDAYRITLTVAISEKEIVLLDIGTHDEVYR